MIARHIVTLLAGSALASLAATAALAQAEDDKTADILVIGSRLNTLEAPAPTASRLGLTALQTPATINSISGDEIRARGDLTIGDAVARAPGITNVGDPGNGGVSYAARGFSDQGSVLQLVDGVRLFPTNGSITFPTDPWMVERIDVLSGPASVLYGQGALGGAVNVVTKKPNRDRFHADAEASYGSQQTMHAAVGIGGPLGEKIAFRADASYRHSDGFIDRGRSRSLALGGALEFRPTETLTLTLRDDYGDSKPMRYFGTPLIDGRLNKDNRDKNYNVRDSQMHFKDNRTTFIAEWAPSDVLTFTNTAYRLTADRFWQNLELYTFDAATRTIARSGNTGIRHDSTQWGDVATAKISTPLSGTMRNDLVVGFDANLIRHNYSHDFGSDPQEDNVNPFNFDPGLFFDTQGIALRYRTRTTERAFFAEDRFQLNDQLSVVGGVRIERDRTARFNFTYDAAGRNIIGETPAINGGNSTYKTFNNTTWRVAGMYQPTPNISLYGQYSTGVDPLGTLTTTSTAASQFAFTNAKGDQIEAGVKASFLDGRGAATLSAYKIVKKGLAAQRFTNGPIEQVGQRSAKGIEATLTLDLPAGFGIDANGAVLQARYDDFISGTANYKGNVPTMVPETTGNLSLRWDATRSLQARAAARYVGRRFTDDANQHRLPAYTVIDASLTYAFTPNIAVDVRATNLFDKDYARTAYGDDTWILGRPRSVDVTLRARF